jgi:hypothetical protein
VRLDPDLKVLARKGHFGVEWRADVLVAGEKADELPVTGGDITDEADAEINRRRCNLVVPGLHTYIPTTTEDYLWPIGRTEVALVANMRFRGGLIVTDDIPLGVYRVQKPRTTLVSSGDRAISFEGYDRATTVSRAKLRAGLTVGATTYLGDLLRELFEPRLPATQVYDFPDNTEDTQILLPQQWDLGDDVWVRGKTLAAGLGFDLYFDAAAVCVLEEATDPIDHGPDFVHTTGETAEILWSDRDQATIKAGEYSVDDEDSWNHIIVKAESSQNNGEIYGEAWDGDPKSPTWIGADDPADPEFGQGPFGDKLLVMSSQIPPSTTVANKVAFHNLVKLAGLTENLTVETFWLPHESGDIVQFDITELEVSNTYVLDGLRQTLDVQGNLQVATRQRRVTGIGS